MEKIKLLVIIVTYNGMKWIERCLKSVLNSSINTDIIIIDNDSTDGTQNYIIQHYPKCILHQSKQNIGFGKANNIGLQYALDNNYDYVYLLNQDAWVFPKTIENLIFTHQKVPQYGILSPIQLQANEMHFDTNFHRDVCSWESNYEILEDFYFNNIKNVYPVKFVMAAHWLISRECILKVGGFSPTFPHYGEDNNYIDRTLFHGFSIGIVPSETAIHDREFRQDSKAKKIYMTNIQNLILLSKINRNNDKVELKRILWNSIRSSYRNKSIKPLADFIVLVKNSPVIFKNRDKSKDCCAFLKVKNYSL